MSNQPDHESQCKRLASHVFTDNMLLHPVLNKDFALPDEECSFFLDAGIIVVVQNHDAEASFYFAILFERPASAHNKAEQRKVWEGTLQPGETRVLRQLVPAGQYGHAYVFAPGLRLMAGRAFI